MGQRWGAALGLLGFCATGLGGCAQGADASTVLGRSLLAVPFFCAAGWGMAFAWGKIRGQRTPREAGGK